MKEMTDSLNESDLNEIIDELEQESQTNVADVKLPKKSIFWRNLKYCWYHPWQQSKMVSRFQKLAGIKPDFIATITLPNGIRIELNRLPSWADVIRYKICGFKLKIYVLEDEQL